MGRVDVATDPRFVKNRWKKGQSGNPAGRPKRRSLEDLVLSVLDEQVGDSGDKLELLARVVVDEAIKKRNTQILRLLLDRIWPAPKSIDLIARRGEDELPEEFPAPALESLPADRLADLRRIAHEAIMGETIEAEFEEVPDADSGERPVQDVRGPSDVEPDLPERADAEAVRPSVEAHALAAGGGEDADDRRPEPPHAQAREGEAVPPEDGEEGEA